MSPAPPDLISGYGQSPADPTFSHGTYLGILFEAEAPDVRDRCFLWDLTNNKPSPAVNDNGNEGAQATEIVYTFNNQSAGVAGIWGQIFDDSGEFNLDGSDKFYWTLTDLGGGGDHYIELYKDAAKTEKIAASNNTANFPATALIENVNFSGILVSPKFK